MKTFFVYGSLKRGGWSNPRLRDCIFVREAKIEGYKMVNLGSFPGAIPTGNPLDVIYGEVFEAGTDVEEEVQASLDQLEGYPHFYGRAEVWVSDLDNENDKIPAVMYILGDSYSHLPVVKGGKW